VCDQDEEKQMGCDPPGPPHATWEDEWRWILCELYKAVDGDCCDLFPPENDGDVGSVESLDSRFDAFMSGGGFSTPAEEAAYLAKIDKFEVIIDKPAASASQAALNKSHDFIEKVREELAPSP